MADSDSDLDKLVREIFLVDQEIELLVRLIEVKRRLRAVLVREQVHAYRPAIDARCRIGACSLNNCLYPDCVAP